MPDGAAFKARETHKGLSVRVVKDYDIDTDDDIIRLDILYGRKAIYPGSCMSPLGLITAIGGGFGPRLSFG